jgi:hypothetical protein
MIFERNDKNNQCGAGKIAPTFDVMMRPTIFDRGPWLPTSAIIERVVLALVVVTGTAIAFLGAAWIDYVATVGHYPNQGELTTWLLQLKA